MPGGTADQLSLALRDTGMSCCRIPAASVTVWLLVEKMTFLFQQ